MSNIKGKLGDWRDPNAPHGSRRTILITVMKNVTRLRNLTALLWVR